MTEFDNIDTAEELTAYINDHFKGAKGKKYIFIDEIQMIDRWEEAVNSFLKKGKL